MAIDCSLSKAIDYSLKVKPCSEGMCLIARRPGETEEALHLRRRERRLNRDLSKSGRMLTARANAIGPLKAHKSPSLQFP